MRLVLGYEYANSVAQVSILNCDVKGSISEISEEVLDEVVTQMKLTSHFSLTNQQTSPPLKN
jgi:hypothetical protein